MTPDNPFNVCKNTSIGQIEECFTVSAMRILIKVLKPHFKHNAVEKRQQSRAIGRIKLGKLKGQLKAVRDDREESDFLFTK